jgi:hypothetical protein
VTVLSAGTCRYCGCADGEPCAYCKGFFGGCNWTSFERVVCGAPACIRAEGKRRKTQRPDRPQSRFAELAAKGWGRGAIRAQLDLERRAARRGKRGKGKVA